MSYDYVTEEVKDASVKDAIAEKRRTASLSAAKSWHKSSFYSDVSYLVDLANADPPSKPGEFLAVAGQNGFWGLYYY
ncbi:hypothetical protein AB0L97_05840 [Nocardia sp. NPDC051911]|uniref:hypothetical protein n=1 Tax=Nocardia sp. NPDC051911 TaxID=3154648 RepID=UPI003413ABB2